MARQRGLLYLSSFLLNIESDWIRSNQIGMECTSTIASKQRVEYSFEIARCLVLIEAVNINPRAIQPLWHQIKTVQ